MKRQESENDKPNAEAEQASAEPPPLPGPLQFFEALYPEDLPGVVMICSGGQVRGAKTRFRQMPLTVSELRETTTWDGVPQETNVWFMVCALKEAPARGRGRQADIWLMPGCWADADFKCCSEELLLQILTDLAAASMSPSIVIRTGNGFHLYWLFTRPIEIEDEEMRLRLRNLNERIGQLLSEAASVFPEATPFDNVSSLDHPMRLPGTLNWKSDEPKPVEVVWIREERYAVEQLDAMLPPLRGKESKPKPDGRTKRVREEALNQQVAARQKNHAAAAYQFSEALKSGPRVGHRDRFFNEFAYVLRKNDTPWEKAEQEINRLFDLTEQPPGQPFELETALVKLQRVYATVDPESVPDWNGGGGPKWRSRTDLGNARRLVRAHGKDLRYAPQLGRWLVWDGRRFAEDVTGHADRLAKDVVDKMMVEANLLSDDDRAALIKHHLRSSAAGRLRAIEEVARTEPGIPVTLDQLDANPMLLDAVNGIVDLRTGALLQHDRSMLMTKMAGGSYEPSAAAPRWEQFILEVFDGNEELAAFAQRFAGYSLTADVSEHIMVFAHGSGANGKSTFLNEIRSAVGDYGLQLDPRILMTSQYDQHPTGLTDLRGARLVTTIETEADRALAEALVKQLTGGDPIRARRMRADYFQFDPTHKLWFAGNHLPAVRGTDHGIWRRIAVLPFDVTFDGDRADKSLAEKLRAERPGILRWMVQGCLEWQRDGLRIPERVRAATAEYRACEDQLGRFIDDCCYLDPAACVSAREFRERYEQWCAYEVEFALNPTVVGRDLAARGYQSLRVGPERTRSWGGIGLLTPTATGLWPNMGI